MEAIDQLAVRIVQLLNINGQLGEENQTLKEELSKLKEDKPASNGKKGLKAVPEKGAG